MKNQINLVYIDSGYSRRGWMELLECDPAFTTLGEPMENQVTVQYRDTSTGDCFRKTIFNLKKHFKKRGAK